MNLFDRIFSVDNGFIKVDAIKSLKKIVFTEVFDENKMAWCINNVDMLKEHYREDARDSLNIGAYLEASKDGAVKVRYLQTSNGMFTRYYAKCGLSGQGMVRECRHIIYDDFYTDIDIKNAHPVIIMWMCQNLEIKYEFLHKYVNDRDNVINTLVDINPGSDYEYFKKLILKINNGGVIPSTVVKNDFLNNYQKEMDRIRKALLTTFHVFKSKTMTQKPDKQYNLDGSSFSNLCQFVENQLLMEMTEYLKKHLNTVEFSNIILCFDGIMIPKNCDASGIIKDMEKMFKNMGIPIKLSIKTMEPLDIESMGYDASNQYTVISDKDKDIILSKEVLKVEKEVINRFNIDDTYDFNDLIHDLLYTTFATHKDLMIYLYANLSRCMALVKDQVVLKDTHNDMNNIHIIERFKEKWRPDMECKWYVKTKNGQSLINMKLSEIIREAPTLISYFKDFSTEILTCKTVFVDRIFYIGESWNAKYIENADYSKIQELLDLILEVHCNNEPKLFDYVMKMFSFWVCNPNEKTGKCLVLLSELGGTGKSAIFELFIKFIFGRKNCLTLSGFDELLAEHNGGLSGKKLIVLEEAPCQKTNYRSDFNKLKNLLTNDCISIRKMRTDYRMEKFCAEIVILSNNLNCVPIDNGDRRYVVNNVNPKYASENASFWDPFYNRIMNQDIGDIFYSYLIDMDVNVREFRRLSIAEHDTKLKQDLIDINKNSVQLFKEVLDMDLADLCEDDISYGFKTSLERGFDIHFDVVDNQLWVRSSYLYSYYKEYCSFTNEKALSQKYFGLDMKKYYENKKSCYSMYKIRDL